MKFSILFEDQLFLIDSLTSYPSTDSEWTAVHYFKLQRGSREEEFSAAATVVNCALQKQQASIAKHKSVYLVLVYLVFPQSYVTVVLL